MITVNIKHVLVLPLTRIIYIVLWIKNNRLSIIYNPPWIIYNRLWIIHNPDQIIYNLDHIIYNPDKIIYNTIWSEFVIGHGLLAGTISR